MKISKLEFENFRNFRDHCRIDFPTDGSVTVIYGSNGVGKTTLHQLFQWIFYGEVHFNKTASQEMYNLDFEESARVRDVFSVWGIIDFEHPDKDGAIEYYSLRREWIYMKYMDESKLIEKKVRLSKKIDDDWKTVSGEPSKVIEQILPSGLSQYFFFDGESMIADLNLKGKDAAKSLRKALYSIFDLDIYEQAIVHLGTQSSGSSTVLGKLYQERIENSTSKDVIIETGNYRQALKRVEDLTAKVQIDKEILERLRKEILELSEKIGGNPSQEVLEKRRKKAKDTIKTLEEAIEREMMSFGASIMENYPYLLISRVVEEAQFRIGLKIEDQKLLPGLQKELVLALLKENICLCGNQITEKERAELEKLKKLFPPLSYKYIYDQFKRSAMRWSAQYDSEILVKHIEAIFRYRDQISELHTLIHDIDEEQKKGQNVDELIAQRAKAEASQRKWQETLEKDTGDLKVQEQIQRSKKKKLDAMLEANATNKNIEMQISVMESVREYFKTALQSSAERYSKSLCFAIQDLLRKMLSGTRWVTMTPQFELSVQDNHGNEAKSEGQFAIVSFAYIGGVFKLLEDIPELKGKEFPLILDGPFSKLDARHRQNVINTIPDYAPQVILFSKDDINACFGEDGINHVWTIYSNDERNVSHVKKGYDPEVFSINGNNN